MRQAVEKRRADVKTEETLSWGSDRGTGKNKEFRYVGEEMKNQSPVEIRQKDIKEFLIMSHQLKPNKAQNTEMKSVYWDLFRWFHAFAVMKQEEDVNRRRDEEPRCDLWRYITPVVMQHCSVQEPPRPTHPPIRARH